MSRLLLVYGAPVHYGQLNELVEEAKASYELCKLVIATLTYPMAQPGSQFCLAGIPVFEANLTMQPQGARLLGDPERTMLKHGSHMCKQLWKLKAKQLPSRLPAGSLSPDEQVALTALTKLLTKSLMDGRPWKLWQVVL